MHIDPVTQFHESIMPAYERYVALSEKKFLEKSELLHAAVNVAGLLFHFRETLALALPNETLDRVTVNNFADYDLEMCSTLLNMVS